MSEIWSIFEVEVHNEKIRLVLVRIWEILIAKTTIEIRIITKNRGSIMKLLQMTSSGILCQGACMKIGMYFAQNQNRQP